MIISTNAKKILTKPKILSRFEKLNSLGIEEKYLTFIKVIYKRDAAGII